MKKTILALTIASSVVLLTGCNAEDEAVDLSGAEIKTEKIATNYAEKVKVMNELIIKNVIENCLDNTQNNVSQEDCSLVDGVTKGNFTMKGKVHVWGSNGKFTIDTDKYAKSLVLKENSKSTFNVYFSKKPNDHKITLEKTKILHEFNVYFSGQYADNHSKPFQANTINNLIYTTDNGINAFKDGTAKVHLKGRNKSWNWIVIGGHVDIIN